MDINVGVFPRWRQQQHTVKMMGVPAFLTPTSRTVLWAISFRAGVDSFDMISNNPLIRIAPMDCAIHDIANIEERERERG